MGLTDLVYICLTQIYEDKILNKYKTIDGLTSSKPSNSEHNSDYNLGCFL